MKIKYSELKNIILENNFHGKNLIVEGTSGSGKTTLAQEKYINMIEKEKIKSENIMVFVLNSHQKVDWTSKMKFDLWGQFKIDTYNNFIIKELTKYWPIVEKNCDEVKEYMIKPEIIYQDTAVYMMEMLVDYFRKNRGYFLDIAEQSKKIAEEFINSMNISVLSLKELKNIGKTIYSSIRLKENKNTDNYIHMDEIIEHYTKSLLSSGSMDMSIAIYLYNKYLLNDKIYIERLSSIKYLIVDDVDQISKAQLKLLELIQERAENIYLFFNPQGGFCNYYGADIEYLDKCKLLSSERLKLEEHFLCSDNLYLFSNTLKLNCASVHIDLSSIFRSEMINKISEKVFNLMENGIDSDDICIISPVNDDILNYEMKTRFASESLNIKNLSKKNRLIDNIYIISIIIILSKCIGCIKHDFTKDDYRRFFSFVLGIDALKAYKLVENIMNFGEFTDLPDEMKNLIGSDASIKYYHILDFIKKCKYKYTKNEVNISRIIRLVFLDVLIDIDNSQQNIGICKNLSEFSEKFISSLKNFKTIENPQQKFIDFVRREAMDFYSRYDIEKMHIEDRGIIIGTPYSFLTSNMKCSVQIWTDIQSNMWCPRNIKEFSNSYLFKANWENGCIYTEQIEEKNRLHLLKLLTKALIKKCSKSIYLYGSEYSVNGYEQRGLLYNLITGE
ncbi:UvrD-helicase domain-containing protein [Clostridium tyrobutyricum]|uniref:UvrD-helicase domain-containing protein n=1 Tax=Clostridium tyrobutyricum TaxID=1519 RepID=UPI00057DB035|nr:UvrD-helicase domain-containing protein [Clostridium tyrobutyricum]MBV4446698.1 hypothetical protein [Clostridium tyrobutyricum]